LAKHLSETIRHSFELCRHSQLTDAIDSRERAYATAAPGARGKVIARRDTSVSPTPTDEVSNAFSALELTKGLYMQHREYGRHEEFSDERSHDGLLG
jgi:hypothetical protein